MSGGITQLVAIGAQDAHIVGNPEISFFHSNYRRHTNFAKLVDRQVIQGNPSANGMSTVRFERKGDLLGHVYITAHTGSGPSFLTSDNWKAAISKIELLVGGQVIDTQTSEFCENLAVDLLAQNLSKSSLGQHHGGSNSYFYPLRFSCFENWQSALPLVALQYHDVEIRITWGSILGGNTFECYADFVYLDVDERKSMAATPQNMLITQVQKAVAPGSKVFDLQFSHPVKFLAMANSSSPPSPFFLTPTKMKLQINGVDMADYKYVKPHFTAAASYYAVPYAFNNQDNYMLYPFCLDTSKIQPTGSLNFSRLDSARIVSDSADIENDVYAVNYNVLRIENGMGGLMYAN